MAFSIRCIVRKKLRTDCPTQLGAYLLSALLECWQLILSGGTVVVTKSVMACCSSHSIRFLERVDVSLLLRLISLV